MGTTRLDGAVLRAFADGAVEVLDAHRAELDALNVFPVADSDTGTNLWLTLREGRAALARLDDGAPPAALARGLARGTLVGARGNSGVIVSQYLGELLRALGDGAVDGAVDAGVVARALRRATDAAYAAVAHPVEGTVLSVARAVADGAAEAAGDVADVLAAGLAAGHAALGRTPEQLAALREAGVLDAGGWGLLLVLRALADACGVPRSAGLVPAPGPADAAVHGHVHDADQGGAFEVMYVVDCGRADGGPTDGVADRLRGALAAVGDSVAVVGGDGLWQAHVHTDTPLEAVGTAAVAGVAATQVRVRHIGRQAGVHGAQAPALGLVAVTGAAGLTADLARAGAVVVLVPPGRAAGPELERAVDDTGADDVLVLAAGGLVASVDRPGLRVRRGLSEAQVVAGAATLAALAGRETDAGRLASAVLAAVDGVRTATVADVGAGGDAGDVGEVVAERVLAAARALVADDTTLLTLLAGADAPGDLGARVAAAVGDRVEVVVLPTGLPGREVVLGAEAGTA